MIASPRVKRSWLWYLRLWRTNWFVTSNDWSRMGKFRINSIWVHLSCWRKPPSPLTSRIIDGLHFPLCSLRLFAIWTRLHKTCSGNLMLLFVENGTFVWTQHSSQVQRHTYDILWPLFSVFFLLFPDNSISLCVGRLVIEGPGKDSAALESIWQ